MGTLLAAAVLSSVAREAEATVVVDLGLEGMVDGADAIVHARVHRSGSRLELEGRRLVPFTIIELEVIEWLKGHGEARIRLREAGGEHPRGRTELVGAPHYAPGEEVVVFLSHAPPYYRTLSLSLGKLVVRRPRGASPPIVEREHAPGLLRLPDPRKNTPDEPGPLELDEFRERVARRLEEDRRASEAAP